MEPITNNALKIIFRQNYNFVLAIADTKHLQELLHQLPNHLLNSAIEKQIIPTINSILLSLGNSSNYMKVIIPTKNGNIMFPENLGTFVFKFFFKNYLKKSLR